MEVIDFSGVTIVWSERFVEDPENIPRVVMHTRLKEGVVGDMSGEIHIDLYLPKREPFRPDASYDLTMAMCQILSTDKAHNYLNELARLLGPTKKIAQLHALEIQFTTHEWHAISAIAHADLANPQVWIGQFVLGLFVNLIYYHTVVEIADNPEETERCTHLLNGIRSITDRFLKVLGLPGGLCTKGDLITYGPSTEPCTVMEVGTTFLVLMPQSGQDEDDLRYVFSPQADMLVNLTRKGSRKLSPGIIQLIQKKPV